MATMGLKNDATFSLFGKKNIENYTKKLFMSFPSNHRCYSASILFSVISFHTQLFHLYFSPHLFI